MSGAGDRILDFGLLALTTESDRVFLCAADPVDYAAANSVHVGVKNGSRGSMFYPISTIGNGRMASLAGFNDGTITANGNANFVVVADSINQNILISEPLSTPKAVKTTGLFSINALDVIIGQSSQPQVSNFTVGSPQIGVPAFAIPLLTAQPITVSSPSIGVPNFVWLGAGWFNVALAAQVGDFTVELDATPSALAIDGAVGLSMGPEVAYSGIACIVLFTATSVIQVRNGAAYAALQVVPYSAGQQFHIRISGNVPNHTYSVWVTPPSQAEIQIASNYSFRTEQQTVPQIDNFVRTLADIGSLSFANLVIGYVAAPLTVGSPVFDVVPLNGRVGFTAVPMVSPSPSVGDVTLNTVSQITHGQQINATNTGRAGAAVSGVANYSSTTTTISGSPTYSTTQTIRNTVFTGPVYVTGGVVTFEFCSFTYAPVTAGTGVRVYNNGAACSGIFNWCTFDTGLRGNAGTFECSGLQAGERGTSNPGTNGSFMNAYRCSVQGYGNGICFESWYSSGSLVSECYITYPTLGASTHADCIEIASSDNVTIQCCRIVLPTSNNTDAYQGCITINNGFGNTPSGNPIIIDRNFINGGISPVMTRGNYVTGGFTRNVRYTGNYWGDVNLYGRNCDFNSMNVTYNLAYALSNSNVIYWENTNVWTPNGEGVTNQVSYSGNAQATSPHVGGAFVTSGNFYGGEVWVWSGSVVGPPPGASFVAPTLTTGSPIIPAAILNKKVGLLAVGTVVSPPTFTQKPLNGKFTLTAINQAAGRPVLNAPGFTIPSVWTDGLSGAPTGTPQYPTLLNNYYPTGQSPGRNKNNGRQPPFNVPGVDYRVGIQTGTVLSPPTSISIPGVTVNTSSKIVTVAANNVTLNAIDFSGGWNLLFPLGWSNLTVTNCRWSSAGIERAVEQWGNNFIMRYCEIDGNFQGVQYYGPITTWGNGTTVEWCLLGNTPGDLFEVQQGPSTFTIRFNVCYNCGDAGAIHHPDITQIQGVGFVVTIFNNLAYCPLPYGTQGFMVNNQLSGQTSQNVIIGNYSTMMNVTNTYLTDIYACRNNYYDPSNTFNVFYPTGPNGVPGDNNPLTVFVNNINMLTGVDLGP